MRDSSFNIVQLLAAVAIGFAGFSLLIACGGSDSDSGDNDSGGASGEKPSGGGAYSIPRRVSPRARLQSMTQMRGIHQGLVTYANSNKNWFPGLGSDGQPARPNSRRRVAPKFSELSKQVGIDVEQRFAVLLSGDFFTPEYAVSPVEQAGEIRAWEDDGPLTERHYSYAMLQVPEKGGRHSEWSQTLNSRAIVISDRNTGTVKRPTSIYDDGVWHGAVTFNDNAVGFEESDIFETQYGPRPEVKTDFLFTADGLDDALMVHAGN